MILGGVDKLLEDAARRSPLVPVRLDDRGEGAPQREPHAVEPSDRQILGHADASTTLNFYVRGNLDQMRAATDKMAAAFDLDGGDEKTEEKTAKN